MLLKKGSYSDDLRTLRGLEKMHPHHRPQISKTISGVEGEKSTAHYLDRDFARDDEFAVLHDVRLGTGRDLAQSDHVVIDRLTGIVWVLETKNIDGTLSWNEHGDWTATYGTRVIAIESPTAQARRHCVSIAEWLARQGMQVTAVRPVVLVGTRTRLGRSVTDDMPVMKADVFPGWLRARRMTTMAAATSSAMTVQDMRSIGERMVAAHVPMQDWKARLHLPSTQSPTRPTSNTTRSTRTMARRSSSFDNLMRIASESQIGAMSVGVLGLLLASPMPHVVLDAVSTRTRSDDPYGAIAANGILAGLYSIMPMIRVAGFGLTGLAIVILLAQGRKPSYRTHLRTVSANAGGAGALTAIAILLAVQDPPRFIPGSRENAEAMAVIQGRNLPPAVARPQERTPSRREAAVEPGEFPGNGTIQWGEEQPIGGDMGQIDIWDATQSPQDKVINIRSALVAMVSGTPAYATVYVRAGQRASIRLPANRPYRITAMSGDRWHGGETLFGPGSTTVDFGMVSPGAAQPQVVVMGAPDQTATVVPASRF